MDRAVGFTILTRAWQGIAGLVTLALIARFFDPELQGFYYTFASLLALQAFVELGLFVVIVNVVSHQWNKLALATTGEVFGDPHAMQRLATITRFVLKWYAGASVVFVVIVGTGGYLFFSTSTEGGAIRWLAPWIAVVVFAAMQFWLLSPTAILEGCNQVGEVNRFRFWQAALDAAATWALLFAGAGLWVIVGSQMIKAATAVIFLATKYRKFFRSILSVQVATLVDWKEQIWPMQWRIAIQGIAGYFVFSLFVPVMFRFHGAEVAGQMGMTLQVVAAINGIAPAWVQTKVSRFGMLVASRNFGELDRLWRQATAISLSFTVLTSVTLWLTLVAINEFTPGLSARFLSPLPSGLLLLAYALLHVTYCQATYLRAHAREPFAKLGVVGGLTAGALICVLGAQYGATGAASGFLATVGALIVPMSTIIWRTRRIEWRTNH